MNDYDVVCPCGWCGKESDLEHDGEVVDGSWHDDSRCPKCNSDEWEID